MKATVMPVHMLLDLYKNIYFSKSYSRKLFVTEKIFPKKIENIFQKHFRKITFLKKIDFSKIMFSKFFRFSKNYFSNILSFENLYFRNKRYVVRSLVVSGSKSSLWSDYEPMTLYFWS